MSTTTWEQFLATDWIGCDVETHEDGYIYRGPIAEIKASGGEVAFYTKWCARMKEDMSVRWEFFRPPLPLIFQCNSHQVADIGMGRAKVDMPMLGFAIFFPKTVSRLNPVNVKGLPERFAEPDFVDPKDSNA